MRLTCLRCGHQVEMATGDGAIPGSCVCGQEYVSPHVVNTGTRPNERAAERSRYRAFRAAGIVKNVGGFALGISLLSILCFPLGIVGAGFGVYVLTMLRGPVGRYSGRRAAAAAVIIGVLAFTGEGALALSWVHRQRQERLGRIQETAAEDLRGLLRAQRLYHAAHDTYGSMNEVKFESARGYSNYTLYLGTDDLIAATRDGTRVVDPLPADIGVATSENTFTAAAVGNLDADVDLDVWIVTDGGELRHVRDDLEPP